MEEQNPLMDWKNDFGGVIRAKSFQTIVYIKTIFI